VLGLTFAGAASAHEPHAIAHGHSHVYAGKAYHLDYGVHFRGGYYYRGHDHHHWAYRVWDPVCSRYQYWDPYVRVFYYWDPCRDCYYPVGW
jgi:hypothetical protein